MDLLQTCHAVILQSGLDLLPRQPARRFEREDLQEQQVHHQSQVDDVPHETPQRLGSSRKVIVRSIAKYLKQEYARPLIDLSDPLNEQGGQPHDRRDGSDRSSDSSCNPDEVIDATDVLRAKGNA